MSSSQETEGTAGSLNDLLESSGRRALDSETLAKFSDYLTLILRWNARMNLTAIRDPQEILSRHFVESIVCAQALPAAITTLLDFGSGAGFPGIPIAICRPEIRVTLAESQSKKAAFLQEAVRGLKLSTRVFAGRAEQLDEQFDCVSLRAVDRMDQAVAAASQLIRPGGWLALFTTQSDLEERFGHAGVGLALKSAEKIPIPGSEQRVLVFGIKN